MRKWILIAVVLAIPLLSLPLLSDERQVNPRANVRSPHGALATPCEECHSYSAWKPIRNIPEFNHSDTKYPLLGMHKDVGCRQCHTNLVFTKVGKQCADCHADIHRRQFGGNCERCHTVKGWNVSVDAVKDHFNRFPLTGMHAVVQCDSCHKSLASGQFQGLSTVCYSCHQADFKTPVIDHVSNGFSTTCTDCHTMDTWLGAKFDHLKVTGFALVGVHATLDCTACHAGGHYKGTPATCYACHQKDFTGTTNPNHVQAGFPHDCSTCHTSVAWSPATFDHGAFTKFPLTGMHATLQCSQCHVNGNYNITATDCASCHMADYNKTTNPNHKAAGLPTGCSICHSTSGWIPASFDHNQTGFPLTGAHVNLQCSQCHLNGQYTAISTDCSSCHMADYNSTTNPPHKSSGFPLTCNVCHTTTAWSPATFEHSKTVFPLIGAHVTVPCASCHINGNYVTTPTTCYSCHQKDFTGTTNPNHVQAGFPHDCSTCHTSFAWSPATFDHGAFTKFPLTGMHATLQCSQCHVNGNYNITATNCASCHIADYNKTTNPNHKAAGLPTDCSICHSTSGWIPASFDHSQTGFPLTGAHVSLQCSQCHLNGQYTAISTDCSSCHMNDYNGTTNPPHKSSGFPLTCNVCHTTTAWSPSTFDHSKTVFPLTGAHVTVPCASCHINGNYTTTPTDCYSCHAADYKGVSNPNHIASGFPTTCATCHTTATWLGATFNHTWFPIYSGTHAGKWTTCNDCHVNPADYSAFSCITCHTHDKSSTDPHHTEVKSYTYTPTSCYSCHRNGNGGG